MKNSYPEKPMLTYVKTSIEMPQAIEYIKALNVPVEVKRVAYIVFRIESSNGQKGINNNYGGIQTDSGRWPIGYDGLILGSVLLSENGTGKSRLFAAFESANSFLEFLSDRLMKRGVYIGGKTWKVWKGTQINNVIDLANAYKKEWVLGDPSAEPSSLELRNFKSMYAQAQNIFLT